MNIVHYLACGIRIVVNVLPRGNQEGTLILWIAQVQDLDIILAYYQYQRQIAVSHVNWHRNNYAILVWMPNAPKFGINLIIGKSGIIRQVNVDASRIKNIFLLMIDWIQGIIIVYSKNIWWKKIKEVCWFILMKEIFLHFFFYSNKF